MASKSGNSGKKSSPKQKDDKRPTGKRNAPPPKPVKNPPPWGMISATLGVVVAAGLLVGLPIYLTSDGDSGGDKSLGPVPKSGVKGVVNYYAEGESWVENGDHVPDSVEYATDPPVGGKHNSAWQTCTGDIYDEPIPNEHAVHSLEHGAVWITYQPDLDDKEVKALAERVEGVDYTLMSPYKDQKSPISVQTWGYQLPVDSADDERIDDFIKAYRLAASREPNAACSSGVTATGDTPSNPGGM